MQRNETELVRPNSFENNIIVVDGLGRSGKNLISVLLSSTKKIEKMRLDSQLDYIPRYYDLSKMTKDAAITALRTEFDQKYYYNSISRDVNFRFGDYSGVWKQGRRFKYFRRLFQPADEAAVLRLKKENPIFQDMTHDALHVVEIFFEALGGRIKFIHVLRDPVGNIFEQNARDFGTRIGSDPREFQLTYKFGNEIVPLVALGSEELYLAGNSIEKLVLTVNTMFRKNMKSFIQLSPSQKNQILFVEFEKFVSSPDRYLCQIEEFTGVKFDRNARRILRREHVPRRVDLSLRQARIDSIQSQLREEYLEIFHGLLSFYESRPWESEI